MLGGPRKNRNKKGLALGAEAAKPGTLFDTPGVISATPPLQQDAVVGRPAAQVPLQLGRPAPPRGGSRASSKASTVEVASRSGDTLDSGYGYQSSPGNSPLLPTSAGHTPSLSNSSGASSRSHRSSYHNKLSEQLATLELGVEFKLDLRSEDLEVLEELGSGNGGTVTKCLHIPTKAIMAKKVVHIATNEATRKQILRELQFMHECSSPYIISFYGAYLQDPHICMCMEFMDKGSLDNIYKKIGPLPEPILGQIAFSVVSGLTYLYEVHKILHRDVKPSNIVVNSAGQIKLCDFGVSGELIASVANTFVGTSTYMSPERISGDPYSVKSDVWSLGITLIELAIGRFPFSADDEPLSDEEDDSLPPLDGVQEEYEIDDAEETLTPATPAMRAQSVQEAERKRTARRESLMSRPRARTTSTSSNLSVKSAKSASAGKRKSVSGVSLAGSGQQMSILELLQYIVNEPAPKLPVGKFSKAAGEFVDATLRKEPVGYNAKKKGPLPTSVARPTPKELLEYKWMIDVQSSDTDMEAFVRSIP